MNTDAKRFCLSFLTLLLTVGLSGAQASVWRTIASGKGRTIEVDTASIQRAADGRILAISRLLLEKEIVDVHTQSSYKYIQTLMRYDCAQRSAATLRRSFLTAEEAVLRSDEMPEAVAMPIRSNTLEEKVMRELCRPAGTRGDMQKLAEDAESAAAALRQSNEAIIKKQLDGIRAAVGKPATAGRQATVYSHRHGAGAKKDAAPDAPRPLAWSYDGPGGPEYWADAAPENLLCREGRRQSPIHIQDGVVVDLEPLFFDYSPAPFSVLDTGRGIEAQGFGHFIVLMGKSYALERVTFQRPGETSIEDETFAMSAHLEHRAFDGERLVVAVMLEIGTENAFIQQVLNYLPLEQNRPVTPEANFDLAQLLPEARGYHTFMGSMTRPPCEEGVIWVALQTPVTLSAEQEAVFARLYPNNARPRQAAHGRLIKSSRPPKTQETAEGEPEGNQDTD
ncbi:MAG: carbonic anhydrase family protein [Zoogloeaceae bacterium]|jgi:carbonic anhydrase|nr:carbonic anhydrase family protein [Zoogloeaceae bacterium]